MNNRKYIVFENYPNFGKLCDEFRQTTIFKQSNGKGLSEEFYVWISLKIIRNIDTK